MAQGIALVTGCSSGIGFEICTALLTRGYTVYASARKPESIQSLADKGAKILQLDVTDDASITAAIASIEANGDTVDLLVNNAGYGLMGPATEISDEAMRHQFETNVFGLMAVTRKVTPGMIKNRRGMILNIGSVSGVLTTPFGGVYCATKAAVHSLSDALRMELAPFGVKVITVQPGAIKSNFGNAADSAMSSGLVEGSAYEPIKDAIAKRAQASQKNPTPVKEFTQILMEKIHVANPKAVLKIGHGSKPLTALKRILPDSLVDKILSKSFNLKKLTQ